MRIELDKEYGLLYIELRDGEVEETLDLAEGVHLDVDAEGQALGIEFMSLEAFEHYLRTHAGAVEIPDVVKDADALKLP